MKIIQLTSKAWSVYAVVTDTNISEETCELLDFLDALPAKYRGSRDGMFQYFERFADLGQSAFNDATCHYVDKDEKIWEFIKGDLRILWFYAGHDKIIVCSHGFRKSGQKTPASQKVKAIAAKNKYLADKASNNIVVVESNEPDE